MYTKKFFGDTLELFPVHPQQGLSLFCDTHGIPTLGCKQKESFYVHNMSELAMLCGESRLWGGMHFTDSIKAGNELAIGIGGLAMDFVKTIKNGSNWTDAPHTFTSSSRPGCGLE